MNITYKPETNTCVVEVNGQTEEKPLEDILDMLPERMVRDKYLINEIFRRRTTIVKQIGDFNEYIVKLSKKIEVFNLKMQDPEISLADVRKYAVIIKAMSDEKNVIRELRHGVKLIENQEGRFEKELAQLETTRG